MSDRVLAETRFLRCIDRDGWSFVERPHASGVVAIVAVTPESRLLIIEQYRPPVQAEVIELPAGLVGDEADSAGEDLARAAARELREETGYEPRALRLLGSCPVSPGITNEVVAFFLATELAKVGDGGGTADEKIRVHEVPLTEVARWLEKRRSDGAMIAATVYTGLHLAGY